MRVKVIGAPGYVDEWEAEHLAYHRNADGRPVAVVVSDDGSWHVIPSQYVREPRTPNSPYDECGCIAPCPDHKSPAQDARRDREYWSAKESEPMAEDDQAEA